MKNILDQKKLPQVVDAGDAGTVLRFLCPVLAFIPGTYILTGSPRMKERPVFPLVDALNAAGFRIEYLEKAGYPPLKISDGKIKKNQVEIDASVSSQMVSALLLLAPFLPQGLTIKLSGEKVSFPYITMTVNLLRRLGVKVIQEINSIHVYPVNLKPAEIHVEKDWSSAAYFYVLVSLHPELKIFFPQLQKGIQGDAELIQIGRELNVESRIQSKGILIENNHRQLPSFYHRDMNPYPDLVPPLVVWLSLLKIPFRLEGVSTLAIKESNRLEALCRESGKMGIFLKHDNQNIWSEKYVFQNNKRIFLETYNDHRITMSFAIAATMNQNLYIMDGDNVKKSFPDFWKEMNQAGFKFIKHEQ